MEKTPDEIYSLYENLSENSRDQASFELYDRDKKRGIYEFGSEAQSGSSRERGLERLAWIDRGTCAPLPFHSSVIAYVRIAGRNCVSA
ncbi:unnamed protein product [Spirodela intermedia]|uniref:Uncharacterized protein n=1 Tax=Spirodela intermedia TaxID=51605 RepID=A0ABN7E8E5_SPIIN|nr:unnamed protein product [Spirodela intermedia]